MGVSVWSLGGRLLVPDLLEDLNQGGAGLLAHPFCDMPVGLLHHVGAVVAQHPAHGIDIDAGLQGQSGEQVPEIVRTRRYILQPASARIFLKWFLRRLSLLCGRPLSWQKTRLLSSYFFFGSFFRASCSCLILFSSSTCSWSSMRYRIDMSFLSFPSITRPFPFTLLICWQT